MANRKSILTDFNKVIDILINPVKKSLRTEFNRVAKLAGSEYKINGQIPEGVWIEHEENLIKIAMKGFLTAQKNGAKYYLNILVKDKLIKKSDLKPVLDDLITDFERFSDDQAAIVAKATAETTKKTLVASLEKYRLQYHLKNERESNSIIDVIAIALEDAKDQAIWRSIIGGLAIIHSGASRGGHTGVKSATKKNYRMVKGWITMRDDDVRDTHTVMDKMVVGVDDKFKVPTGGGYDMMDYPGDMSASIGNWINCRCTLTYEKETEGKVEWTD